MSRRAPSLAASLVWASPLAVPLATIPLYGGDTPAAALALSAVAFLLAAVTVIFSPQRPMQLPLIGAFFYVAFVGLARYQGWLSSGAHEYAALGACGALCLIGYLAGHNGRLVERLWQWSLWAGGALAIAAFLDFALEPDLSFGRARPYHTERLAAPFLSSNTAATFYGIIAVMSAAELIRILSAPADHPLKTVERIVVRGLFPTTYLLFAFANVILTASRAGLLVTVAGLLLLTGWELLSRLLRGRLTLSLAKLGAAGAVTSIIAGALFLTSGELLQDRLAIAAEDDTRIVLLQAYASAVELEPALGHGLGSFAWVNDLIVTPDNADLLQTQGAAHNVYLQWLLQGGLVGTILLGLVVLPIVLTIFLGLGRRRRRTTYMRATLCIVLLVGAHGMVDYAVEIPMVAWWLSWLLGLAAGLAVKGRTAS